ncbi:IS66 family insertion sequence element accessory protein TnpB [Enterobacter ludwigii]
MALFSLHKSCTNAGHTNGLNIPVKMSSPRRYREWPQDVAKAQRRAGEPTVLPVHIAEPAPPAEPFSATANEPVTLFLPGGIRMCCHPSQLTDVFRALKYADA